MWVLSKLQPFCNNNQNDDNNNTDNDDGDGFWDVSKGR